MFQVTIGNQFTLGMFMEPALAVSQESFHFRVPNPVVRIVT
jgi:hypothetical protein